MESRDARACCNLFEVKRSVEQRGAADARGDARRAKRGDVTRVADAAGRDPFDAAPSRGELGVQRNVGSTMHAVARDIGAERVSQAICGEAVEQLRAVRIALASPGVDGGTQVSVEADTHIERQAKTLRAKLRQPRS